MALTKLQPDRPRRMSPRWPDTLPAAETLHAAYGAEADELTIRFPNMPNRDIVVLWLETPPIEYAGLMVHEQTGMVVGVQIDYLTGYTQDIHPSWRAANEPNPHPAISASIVQDVRTLFDRYGISVPEPG